MQTKVHLAAIVFVCMSLSAAAAQEAPQKVNAMLCNTEEQAVAVASNLASGQTEPIAVNWVNKSAGAEVCGRFIGYAVIQTQKTENKGGALFMLIQFRFAEDGRSGWGASWVTPFNGLDLARGI